jgi:7,8-dihydro-6-hydroxymethylpterin-pyrophosphokinase
VGLNFTIVAQDLTDRLQKQVEDRLSQEKKLAWSIRTLYLDVVMKCGSGFIVYLGRYISKGR